MGTSDQNSAGQGRTLAIVISCTVALWMGAQVLGRAIGLPGRYALLFDFAAIAAFIWVMVAALRIWRNQRHDNER
jgi:predicted branched-subunit amino acid permease